MKNNKVLFEPSSNFNSYDLDDSVFQMGGNFSSADGLESGEYEASDDDETDGDINSSDYGSEDEQEYEDEDSTDSEFSDEEGVSEQDLPKFRSLVRNKKLELKAQYGKTRIVMKKKCRKIKLPKAYTERECKSFCVAWYTLNRDGHRAGDCKRREEVCANIPKIRLVEKNVCIRIPKKQWGWRKRWRDFKRAGGLAQLKMQSKGLTPPPIVVPSTSTTAPTVPPKFVINKTLVIKPTKKNSGTSLQSDTFVKGNRGVKKDTSKDTQGDSNKESSESKSDESADEKKFLWMPKKIGISVAIVGGLALAFGGYKLYVKLKK
jgi:hypothetical protein